MFIRLKPYNQKLGQLRKTYSIKGNHFVAGGAAIEIDDPEIIARLKAHKNDGAKETLAFELSPTPFDQAEEEEEDLAPAASTPAKPAAAPRGKPGPKPGQKKTQRGTVPSIEAE